jgi:integrase
MTSLKTVWGNIKETAGITGRWHDTRHTLVRELAQSGAGDQTIMDIAGHVSRQMPAHYCHIRMEAKRRLRSVEEPAKKQRKRLPAATASSSPLVAHRAMGHPFTVAARCGTPSR